MRPGQPGARAARRRDRDLASKAVCRSRVARDRAAPCRGSATAGSTATAPGRGRGASGLFARVVQHEVDHLDGVLFRCACPICATGVHQRASATSTGLAGREETAHDERGRGGAPRAQGPAAGSRPAARAPSTAGAGARCSTPARDAGLDPATARRLFPQGGDSLLAWLDDWADRRMLGAGGARICATARPPTDRPAGAHPARAAGAAPRGAAAGGRRARPAGQSVGPARAFGERSI